MRAPHTVAVTLNLAQYLAIEVRCYANRAPTILKVSDPSDSNLVLRVSASDLRPIEGAAITVAERRWAAGSCGVKPHPSERSGRKIDPPILKILVDVTQDVRTLHRRAKRTSGAGRSRRVTSVHAE